MSEHFEKARELGKLLLETPEGKRYQAEGQSAAAEFYGVIGQVFDIIAATATGEIPRGCGGCGGCGKK